MSCECSNNGVRELPTTIVCTIADSFSTSKTWDRVVGFRGELTGNHNDKVEVEFFAKTREDAEFFNMWFTGELQNGELDFNIDLPITGVVKAHKVKFLPGINKNSFIGSTNKFKATLEVVELNTSYECKIC